MLLLDYALRLFVAVLTVLTRCKAARIKNLSVPGLVEAGSPSLTLDCDYRVDNESGLVVKWFFNSRNLVYQWIPPLNPQVIGILKDKVDRSFRVSDQPSLLHRAVRVLRPSTDLSGNYTCVVSTFVEEDRQTKTMLVYSTGKRFRFAQEKKYVFLVTLLCSSEDLYPRPSMFILSRGKPLPQAVVDVTMDSWGQYSISARAVVHDDDVVGPEEFVCELRLPAANISLYRTSVYYPGLMPTAQVSSVEVLEKAQEHQAASARDSRIKATRALAAVAALSVLTLGYSQRLERI